MKVEPKIKFIFLGTATSIGVPVIACSCSVCNSNDIKDKRLRSSLLVEVNEQTIVIDCGPDFREQMLRENVRRLDAIIFTHEHRDHIAGLDDIRAFNYIMKKDVPVYAARRVIDAISVEFPYIFSKKKYKGSPELDVNIIRNEPFKINGLLIQPIELLHHKLPIFGFRIHDFVYITDASSIPDDEMIKLKGAKVLVINALRKRKHFSHFTLQEALEIIEKVNPEKAFLTHVSHLLGKHEDISRELPENVYLAYDGLTVET